MNICITSQCVLHATGICQLRKYTLDDERVPVTRAFAQPVRYTSVCCDTRGYRYSSRSLLGRHAPPRVPASYSRVIKCYANMTVAQDTTIADDQQVTMEAILVRDQRTTSHRVLDHRRISPNGLNDTITTATTAAAAATTTSHQLNRPSTQTTITAKWCRTILDKNQRLTTVIASGTERNHPKKRRLSYDSCPVSAFYDDRRIRSRCDASVVAATTWLSKFNYSLHNPQSTVYSLGNTSCSMFFSCRVFSRKHGVAREANSSVLSPSFSFTFSLLVIRHFIRSISFVCSILCRSLRYFIELERPPIASLLPF